MPRDIFTYFPLPTHYLLIRYPHHFEKCAILPSEQYIRAMNIKIYSTPSCPYCKLAKDFMTEKKIEYKEVDVASDPASANEMVKISGQMGVPVIDIEGQIIVGWNKDAIEEAISSAGAKKPAKEKVASK